MDKWMTYTLYIYILNSGCPIHYIYIKRMYRAPTYLSFLGKRLSYSLFAVAYLDLNAEFLVQMFCQMLCRVDTAVLSACASEGEHKVGEAAVDVALHMSVCQLIDAIEKGEYLAIVFKEANNRLVQTRKLLIRLVATGVVRRATIEHVTTAIARLVGGYALAIGETENANTQRSFAVVL